jgi:hypothetical protein
VVKNRNKRKKMRLFFEKNQKIGLFLGRFYVFFRVFEAKNTVPKTGLPRRSQRRRRVAAIPAESGKCKIHAFRR